MKDRVRWRFTAFVAALGLAVSAFGGFVMPQMIGKGVPASLTQGGDPRVVLTARHKEGRDCPGRVWRALPNGLGDLSDR